MGEPAIWTPESIGSLVRDPAALKRRLAERLDAPDAPDVRPAAVAGMDLRSAAVLVPIIAGPLGAEILFIRRPEAMREHSGQIAFPGGRVDPGEDPLTTALREANEELGLDPAAGQVLGRFPGIPTITNYWVHPIVAWYDHEPDLFPNPHEVDEAFFARLATLLDPDIYSGKPVTWQGRRGQIDYFNYPHPSGDTKVIWGATGRLLNQFLTRAFDWVPPGGLPDFEPDFV